MGSGEYFCSDIIMLTLLQITNLGELTISSDQNTTHHIIAGLNLSGRGRPFRKMTTVRFSGAVVAVIALN